LMYEDNRERANELLQLIDTARNDGLDVTLDTYPYTAAGGSLGIYLPGWLREGSAADTLDRLRSNEVRERLRREMTVEVECTGEPMDWDAIVISGSDSAVFQPWVGRSIGETGRREGREPFDCFIELVLTDGVGVPCVEFAAYEEVVETIMKHPAHMAASDGGFEGTRPHPRAWGTFARYLGLYCRERRAFPLEEIVRKMTSLPASRLQFEDRGILRPGAAADIAVFDADRVIDQATYEEPTRLAVGFQYVVVNGTIVVDNGEDSGASPGRALRHGEA
jgi:N-acyl-D-amino-acid deacylase